MYEPSKAWSLRRKEGQHGIVTFDVTCDFCNKLLAEDIDSDDIRKHCLQSEKPILTFCKDKDCWKNYQDKHNIYLWRYGWY